MRAWMLFMGAAMIIVGVVTAISSRIEQAASSAPPQYGIIQSGLVVDSCEAALTQVSNPPATFIADEPDEGLLDAGRAEEYADEVLSSYLGLGEGDVPTYAGGPDLVLATLPDGSQQQVWARVWIPGEVTEPEPTATPSGATPEVPPAAEAVEDIGEIVAPGEPGQPNALVLYIEPVSGEPLVLYDAVRIQTPLLAGCDETFISAAAESVWQAITPSRQTIGLLLALVGGVITLAFWQVGKRQEVPSHVVVQEEGELVPGHDEEVQEDGILGMIHRVTRRFEDRHGGGRGPF